jgi:hypothetical protein
MNSPMDVARESRASARDILLAASLVLALRGVYLGRFGWDACWMNVNFLNEAKAFVLGRWAEPNGLPLTPFALWLGRRIGLDALGALGGVYLLGQALFTVAALALFCFFVPAASRRRLAIFAGALALVPILSLDTAYKDLAVLLGAGLFLAAVAAAFHAAASDRPRPALWIGTALFAALGGACRFESLAGTVSAGAALMLFGTSIRPVAGLHRPRAAALALGVGSGLGLVLALELALAMRGRAEIGSAAYSFYTFSDGLPFLMRLHAAGRGEYGRYAAAMGIFGGFAQNHGSLAAALLAHPRAAVLRFVLKVPDLFVGLLDPRGVTPAVVGLALVGLWRLRRATATAGRPRAVLMLAFLGPLALLFVPPVASQYYLPLLFPILCAATLGIDELAARASDRAVTAAVAAALVVGALAVALFGRTERTSSPAVNQAARFLEARCRDGCLVNYPSQIIAAEVWADLEAGAPLSIKVKRSEAFVLGQYPAGYEDGCRFADRIARARAAGYRGPVLYVDPQLDGARIFDDAFDPEHRFEGRPDLAKATLERRFTSGRDSVTIYRLNATD